MRNRASLGHWGTGMCLVASGCAGGGARTASTDASTGQMDVVAMLDAGYSGPCVIPASNYDQSCTVDPDCIIIGVGDLCVTGECLCLGSNARAEAINVGDQAEYGRDISMTPQGMEMP